jgi:CRISPR-associated protein Csm5
MTRTSYTVTCLSPVHVGTGTQCGKFDAVYDGGRWYRIDLDRVLARGADATELARAMSQRNFSWGVWLREHGIPPAEVAAYDLPCPEAPGEVSVREVHKDVWGQPYLPGSSLKGAIRTAVLWWRLQEDPSLLQKATDRMALRIKSLELLQALDEMPGDERQFADAAAHRHAIEQIFGGERAAPLCAALHAAVHDLFRKSAHQLSRRDFERFAEWNYKRNQVEPNSRYADDLIERLVLGHNPNHDLLRAVQVRDSAPVSLAGLAVGLVWTYTIRNNRLVEKHEAGSDYRAFVEWLAEAISLRLDINTDDFLLGRTADAKLRFTPEQKHAVQELARPCNGYARAIIEAEKNHFARYGLDALHQYYIDLERTLDDLPRGAFLLNVGWGGGWEVKTVGDLLREALGDDWHALRERYSLGRNPQTRQIDWQAPFPKTRRVAYDRGAPRWAMGWVRLTPA